MPAVTPDQLGIWTICALLALDVYLRVAAHLREKAAATDGAKTVVGPQPLVVKAHQDCADREDLEQLATKLDNELGRERGARKKMHEEIADLQGDVKVLQHATETQTRQLTVMDQKMDQVLLRLPRKEV